jgi:hypothetical protein
VCSYARLEVVGGFALAIFVVRPATPLDCRLPT